MSEVKKQRFNKLPLWLDRDKTIPNCVKRTWVAVNALQWKKGHCFASRAYLADIVCVTERTLTRHVAILTRLGLMTIKVTGRENQLTAIDPTLDKDVPSPLFPGSCVQDSEKTTIAYKEVSPSRQENEISKNDIDLDSLPANYKPNSQPDCDQAELCQTFTEPANPGYHAVDSIAKRFFPKKPLGKWFVPNLIRVGTECEMSPTQLATFLNSKLFAYGPGNPDAPTFKNWLPTIVRNNYAQERERLAKEGWVMPTVERMRLDDMTEFHSSLQETS